VWVDLVSATEQELAKMGEEFGIHELAIEDCAHHHQRPELFRSGSGFLLYGSSTSWWTPSSRRWT
jgi:magnesium transporter